MYVCECDGTTKFYQIWYLYGVLIMNTVQEWIKTHTPAWQPLSKGTMHVFVLWNNEYFVTHKFLIHIVGNLLYGKSSLSFSFVITVTTPVWPNRFESLAQRKHCVNVDFVFCVVLCARVCKCYSNSSDFHLP